MADRDARRHDGTLQVSTVQAAVTNGLEAGGHAAYAWLLVDARHLSHLDLLSSLQLTNGILTSLQRPIEDWALLHDFVLLRSGRFLVLHLQNQELLGKYVELDAHDYFVDGGRRRSVLLC